MLTPGIKVKLGVDDTYSMGCILTLGYSVDPAPHGERDDAVTIWYK